MTRNLYVGSEFGPVMAAETVEEALAAVPEVHREILASDFAARAGRIAEEIADARPDLIGLQEALKRAGVEYQPVAQIWNIDATMPSGFPPKRMLRLTDRDAVLARSGLT